jgi:hypothetical protein
MALRAGYKAIAKGSLQIGDRRWLIADFGCVHSFTILYDP